MIHHVYNYEYDANSKRIKEVSISYDNGIARNPFVTLLEYSNNFKTVKGLRENGDIEIKEYDNYNSPFSNIPSYTILGFNNNRVSFKYYNEEGVLNETVSDEYVDFRYDDDGFLVYKKHIAPSHTDTFEYVYNK